LPFGILQRESLNGSSGFFLLRHCFIASLKVSKERSQRMVGIKDMKCYQKCMGFFSFAA